MANTIKIKQSAVASKVPLTTDLSLGELAVNTYDGKLFLKKNVSGTETIVEIGAGGGGGGASTTISDTAPVAPTAGDMWWDSAEGILKIYYTDANSSQWVAASPNTYGSGGVIGVTVSNIEVDIGNNPRRSGKFDIAGFGLATGKPVIIQQAVGPYTGKGTLADETEMDQLLITASVANSTTITAYWTSHYPVRGNFKFNYTIGA